jgi:DNA-binding LacI/PurR family transcriptional regulator
MKEAPVADRIAAIRSMLDRSDRPTALVVQSSSLEVLRAASELRLRIGKDLSLAGFASELGMEACWDATAMQPYGLMGQVAVELLLARMGGKSRQPARLVPMEITDNVKRE